MSLYINGCRSCTKFRIALFLLKVPIISPAELSFLKYKFCCCLLSRHHVSLEGNLDQNGHCPPPQITAYTERRYKIYQCPYLMGFNKNEILWKNGVDNNFFWRKKINCLNKTVQNKVGFLFINFQVIYLKECIQSLFRRKLITDQTKNKNETQCDNKVNL